MSGPFSSVAGAQVVSGSLLVPSVGAWTADLHLATVQALNGVVSVVVGTLTLSGAVVRADAYGGQTRVRLVGGKGGWRGVVTPQGYGNPSGVAISTVVQDAANACGEVLGPVPPGNVGNAYARSGASDAPASDVLWYLLARKLVTGWRVDQTGTTQLSEWPTTIVSTPFIPTDQRPDEGVVVVATEDYASWLPGASLSSPLLDATYTAKSISFVWTPDGQFRLEVFTGSADALSPIEAVIARQVSPTRWFGRYAYTISNPSPTTIDATPVNPDIGLPELQSVPITASSIAAYTPPDGGACRIMFADGDQGQPECVWTAEAPTSAQLMSGTTPAAKLGDTVQSIVTGGLTVLAGTLTITIAAPFVPGTPNPATITTGLLTVQGLAPISGTITTGSAKLSVPGT